MNEWPADPARTGSECCVPGHCVTCADEVLPARVLRLDEAHGLALVQIGDTMEEIDITLVSNVTVGAMLLVHGGVAIDG